MNKAGYFAIADDASSYYRMQGVMPFINHPKIKLTDISHLNTASWSVLCGFDTIIIQRPFSDVHSGIILLAQSMNIKVIIDWDDDPLNVPLHNPAYEIYNVAYKKNVKECILYADEIWCSTEAIKTSLSSFNKNIHVIPNAHNNFIYHENDKRPFNAISKIITYRGGATHVLDIFHKIQDIAMVMNSNTDYNFHFIGTQLNELASITGDNHSFTNRIPIIQYLRYLYDLKSFGMMCPLQDTKLNRAKSHISWLEITYAGGVLFGNKTLQEFNHDGIIDFSDFINSTYRYLTDEKDRLETLEELHNDSWNEIRDKFLLSVTNELRIKRLLA